MAEIKIIASVGIRQGRSGCHGCADNRCFGNKDYKPELTEEQRVAVAQWREYIAGRIAREDQS